MLVISPLMRRMLRGRPNDLELARGALSCLLVTQTPAVSRGWRASRGSRVFARVVDVLRCR